MLTYYDLLGVPPNATEKDIKSAYRRLVKQYHPDRASDSQAQVISPDSPSFHDVTEAYHVLKDAEKRAAYDRQIARALIPHEQVVIEAQYSRRFAFFAGIMGGLIIAALALAYLPSLLQNTGLSALKLDDRAPVVSAQGDQTAPPSAEAETAGNNTQRPPADLGRQAVAAATEGSAEPQEDGVSAEVGGETAVTSSRKSNKEGGTALAAKEPEAGLPENNANAVTALPPEPDPLAVAVERATRWASLQTSQDLTEIIAFAEAESGTEEGLAAANRLAALVAASSRIDELQSAVESATDESSRKIITARIAELQAEIAKEAKRGTAWATASKINTPYAYRAFLKSYPSGAWSDEARDRLIRAGLLEVAVGVGTASEPAWLKPGDPTNGAFKDCANCPEMVTIPVGEYRVPPRRRPGMRSQPEEPVPAVRFNTSFAVSRYEVTALEWEGCVADRRCRRVPTGLAASHAPITDVSWHDAMDYVAWLARKTGKRYRLLSEAEWEYAARAGNERPFIWGERPDAVEAAYRGSDFRRTDTAYRPEVDEPYASKPNAWGLHNLHGNVVEWVDDCWLKGLEALPPTGEPIREKDGADCSHRVLKGGSWVGRAGRRANRAGEIAEARDVFTGFRVARDF